MASTGEELWTVESVDRKGRREILVPSDAISISPGTGSSQDPITVQLPHVATLLRGSCVRQGTMEWIQATCQEDRVFYIFFGAFRGERIEGFVARIGESDISDDVRDTETWTAVRPPDGGEDSDGE